MTTTTFYNSQPVDDYIRELSLREKEITRSRGIDNFKKEVPYKILLFLGYVAGICLLILCLFYGLKNLLIRYGVIYEAPLSGAPVITSPYKPQSLISDYENDDQLIDVESILEEANNNKRESYPGSGDNSFASNISSVSTAGHTPPADSGSRYDPSIERPIRNNQSGGSGLGGIGSGSSDQGSDPSIERPIRNDQSGGNGSGNSGSISQAIDEQCNCSVDNQDPGPASVSAKIESINCENRMIGEPIEIDQPKEGSVRDFVIFDTALFDGEYISELVVGRRYENPNAEANQSWCYSELMYASGLRKTLYLVSTENGVLKPTEITHEIADKFGVPISEIHRAQRSCRI